MGSVAIFCAYAPFDASTLVLFRKRISADMLMEVNEYLLAHKEDDKDDHTPPSVGKSGDDGTAKEDTNKGTLTLDATCAPANIRYPQDISLLNEAREKLENMIYCFCKCYGLNWRHSGIGWINSAQTREPVWRKR